MSRIGNRPIDLPQGVSLICNKDTNIVHVKGAKGNLFQYVDPVIKVVVEENCIQLSRTSDAKSDKSLHGLYRSLLNNMVIGVSHGFKKTLELIGVGYKASVQGKILELSLGYSHNISFVLPPEVTVVAEVVKGQNPLIHIEGIDNQLVGQLAAKIKFLRKVEPYKGKGIRFLGEKIRRKAGKTTSK